jgi:hypothetical protein
MRLQHQSSKDNPLLQDIYQFLLLTPVQVFQSKGRLAVLSWLALLILSIFLCKLTKTKGGGYINSAQVFALPLFEELIASMRNRGIDFSVFMVDYGQ